MMPHSLKGAGPDGRWQVSWEDGERAFCGGWYSGDDGSERAVLVVLPVAEHPSASILDRLAHEYELKDELDAAWAVRPLELVRHGGRTMLVLDDPGGQPLDRLLAAPIEMGSFLPAALLVSYAL